MLRSKQLLHFGKGARSLIVSGVRNNSLDGGSASSPEDDNNVPKSRFNSSTDSSTHRYSHLSSSKFSNSNDTTRPSFTSDKYPSSRSKVPPEVGIPGAEKEAVKQEASRAVKVQNAAELDNSISTEVPDNSIGGGLKAVKHLSVSSDAQEAACPHSSIQSGAVRRKPTSPNSSSKSFSASSTGKKEFQKQNAPEGSSNLSKTQRTFSQEYGEHSPYSNSRQDAPPLRQEYLPGVQGQKQQCFSSNPSKHTYPKGYCSTANVQGKSGFLQPHLIQISEDDERQCFEIPLASGTSSSPSQYVGYKNNPESKSKWRTSNATDKIHPGKLSTNGNNRGQPENRRRGMNKGHAGGNKKNGNRSQWASPPAKGSLVEQVSSILRQMYWGPATVEALANLNAKLNVYQVNQVLKQQQEPGLALNFFNWAKGQAGFKHDEHSYTTMIGILGRARRFDVINTLLDEMQKEGCEPTVVTYNRLIHCYGRANYLGEALDIFHKMQEAGCRPDKVTYCTLIDIHAKAGFLNVAMEMYRKMQQAGLTPDTFTYSVIINCLGKAGNLPAAYKLFCEMIDRGYVPNLVTYNIIMDLHAKARKYSTVLKLYRDMQNAGFQADQVSYNIVMEVLGHCGRFEEAEAVFMEMQQAGWTPDEPVYGLLVDMWGKAGNVDKASIWYAKMLNSGLRPNVPTCNSLLSAFLRAHMFSNAQMVLQTMLQLNLFPSLQTYTLLLSCCTSSVCQQDMNLFSRLLANTGHPAHCFLVSLPTAEPSGQNIREHATSFFELMRSEDQESKRGFADAITNFLYKSDLKEEAGFVWEVAMEKNLYPHAVTRKAPKYWTINLHVMSMGTALVALSRTLSSFRERMLISGVGPDRIDIITGWGRRSRVMGSSLVKQSVEHVLNIFGSPFSVENGNSGCFVGLGKPLIEWLQESPVERMHLL
ncbi:pentatricopeptide repeat-containing protein At1g18900 [Cryptomeria japonica]|uniref:pentatricopeptide repeat-containing protein At1g18900 n=1 Tax=Cryptomeria japonica TaxID=3369 RepID=UPI0027DA08A3|nr:pentatricopeptide repeat-containing protein At1g18900 [Cryptomeria japonica]